MTASLWKKLILGVLVAAVFAGGLTVRFLGLFDYGALLEALEGVSPVFFIIVYLLLRVTFIPTLPLNIGAGFLFGPLAGGLYSVIGSTLGAMLSFLVGRYLFHEGVRLRILPRLRERSAERVDDMLRHCDWHTVAFVMLNPVFPSGVLSYLFGITQIRFLTYTWATLLFTIPPTFLFSYFGETLKNMLFSGDPRAIAINVGVLLLSGSLLVFVQARLRRRKEFQPASSRAS